MGTLKAGDKVFDEQGLPCTVVQAHDTLIGRACYRVVFSDGSNVVADADHLWYTETRRSRKALGRRIEHPNTRLDRPQCVPAPLQLIHSTEDIASTLYDRGEVNHAVPLAHPLQLPYKANLPIHPYVLGAWLGDGSKAGSVVTSGDPEILAEIESCGEAMGLVVAGAGCVNASFGNAPYNRSVTTGRMLSNGSLHSRLKALGVLRNKHIPLVYLRASESQRLALLQGLMDTDGHITPGGHAEYCCTRPMLMEDVQELVCSLGLKAGLVSKGDRLTFTPYSHQPVFRLHRKKAKLKPAGAQSEKQHRRYIVAVEPVPSVPVRCITVNSPSRLYLAGMAMIPTHNTRTGAEATKEWVEKGARRLALVAATPADARDVMIEGESGLLNIYPPRLRPNYQSSKRRVTFHNGAIATIYSAHKHSDKSGLRGPQHEKAWGDEPAKWQYPDNVDQLMLGLRLGQNPQAVFTGTPRSIPLIRDWVKESRKPNSSIRLTLGTTYENRANLAESWFTRIINKYTGTRLGEQELLAKILDDVQGALWTYKMIQACMDDVHSLEYLDIVDARGERIVDGINQTLRDSMERVVVAVDPSVSDGKPVDVTAEQTAETGIMVGGRRQDKGHLLEDASLYAHPSEWAQRAVDMFHRWNADYIVAEKNNGGELVRLTIQSVPGARNIPVKLVSASRGKYTRAEPVALIHERGIIRHHLACPALEDQLTTWVPGMKSPDRLDAYVWLMTELLVDLLTFGISMAGEDDTKHADDTEDHTPKEVVGVQEIDRTILGAIRSGGMYFPNGG